MAITAERFTVSDEPVALNVASTAGQSLTIANTSANAVDIGAADVAATEGLALAGGATVSIPLKPGDTLFAIRSADADATLAVLRT